MNSELLAKQIETYSNAIVAFVVLQGLAYCFAFGSNAFFNCLVKTASHLAEFLVVQFAVVAVLALLATALLARALQRLSGGFAGTVRKLYLGKMVAILIFSLLPVLLTYGYGVRDYPGKAECKAWAFK
jgi:hypothetical protein